MGKIIYLIQSWFGFAIVCIDFDIGRFLSIPCPFEQKREYLRARQSVGKYRLPHKKKPKPKKSGYRNW